MQSDTSVGPNIPTYHFYGDKNQLCRVDPRRAAEAARIDTNHDGILQNDEIQKYLRERDILKDPSICHVNTGQVMADARAWLAGKRLPQSDAYHTYQEVADELHKLAQDHPDRCQVVSLGKSVEGRDLWGVKISTGAQGDTSGKPAVVFTGAHHAREWMSMEVPLYLAETLVNNYDSDPDVKRRVDNAEIWVVPMVNPDGYEYSRTVDTWWRKNRDPIVDTGCPAGAGDVNFPSPRGACERRDGEPVATGVDLNRNYYDGNPDHFKYYRSEADKPCDVSDDVGASDSPNNDVYRGPKGGSEPEVKAMMSLAYGRPNVHGIIDHHGYGELLLRPWGFTEDPPPEIGDYDKVAQRMMVAQTNPYRYIPGMSLYATSGTSVDMHEANGKYAFTIELGTSFQPPPDEFDNLKKNVSAADWAFLDWIVEKYSSAPPPAPQPPPVPQPPPQPPANASAQ